MSADQLFEKTARLYGSRVSRRSFVGRIALGVTAMGRRPGIRPLGNTRYQLRLQGLRRQHIVRRLVLPRLPLGTCAGGSWYMCTGACRPDYYTRFQDCMPTHGCSKYCGKDTGGRGVTTGLPTAHAAAPVGCLVPWAVTCLGPASCSGSITGCT